MKKPFTFYKIATDTWSSVQVFSFALHVDLLQCMKVAANSSAGPVLELLASMLQVCSVEKVKTILNRAYFYTWHTVYCLLKDFLFYTLIHHRCSIFNTLNSEKALVRHSNLRDIQLLHCSTSYRDDAELQNI